MLCIVCSDKHWIAEANGWIKLCDGGSSAIDLQFHIFLKRSLDSGIKNVVLIRKIVWHFCKDI